MGGNKTYKCRGMDQLAGFRRNDKEYFGILTVIAFLQSFGAKTVNTFSGEICLFTFEAREGSQKKLLKISLTIFC